MSHRTVQFKELSKQAEFGRKGLAMLDQARNLLTEEMESIPKNLHSLDHVDKVLEAYQRFLNRVHLILAGLRDENDPKFVAGVGLSKDAKVKQEPKTS